MGLMLIEVQTIRTAQRIAYVECLTGVGVLLVPDPWTNGAEWSASTMEEIEALKGQPGDPLTMAALERADAAAMRAKLEAAGWHLRDARDEAYHVGYARGRLPYLQPRETSDGLPGYMVLALDRERRVIERPTVDQLQEADEAVYSAAGVERIEL